MQEREPVTSSEYPLPRLLPGEILASLEIVPVDIYYPTEPPSSFHELHRLAQVSAEGQVGQFGPSLAALALERPDTVEISPELRKFEAIFGRDSLRVALDVMPLYPLLMHATLHTLTELQGTTIDQAREEEPGRIIHESRKPEDPLAQQLTQERGWQWPYYGSVDATPQFMHAMYRYYKLAPDGQSIFREQIRDKDGEIRTMADSYKAALAWLENRMNANEQGFLEFKSSIPNGIENQVWRDSWDAYFHHDGTLANHEQGIASCEVQQLAFDALLEAAEIHEAIFHDLERAASLRERAERLRLEIFEHMWVNEKGGYFALGTDRDDNAMPRPLKIRTSNMGHLLRSRLLRGEAYRPYREAIISQLFSPEMLNVSGIRTLATDEVRFRPGAYHNGSVWLWDTYYTAEGLRYHGYYGLASALADKIHTVINVTQKFPEYVRGDNSPHPTLNTQIVRVWDEIAGRVNTIEQPPQEVQAWSVAADIARIYYSGRVPDRAYDARTARLEDAILSTLPEPLAA